MDWSFEITFSTILKRKTPNHLTLLSPFPLYFLYRFYFSLNFLKPQKREIPIGILLFLVFKVKRENAELGVEWLLQPWPNYLYGYNRCLHCCNFCCKFLVFAMKIITYPSLFLVVEKEKKNVTKGKFSKSSIVMFVWKENRASQKEHLWLSWLYHYC